MFALESLDNAAIFCTKYSMSGFNCEEDGVELDISGLEFFATKFRPFNSSGLTWGWGSMHGTFLLALVDPDCCGLAAVEVKGNSGSDSVDLLSTAPVN